MVMIASRADSRIADLRASEAREASSAAFWARNRPIWSPRAARVLIRAGSGFLDSAQKNSITPRTWSPCTTGNPTAPRRPAARATADRGKFGSTTTSLIHTGSRFCHTRPGNPSPGVKANSRLTASKGASSGRAARQKSTQRRTPAGPCTLQMAPDSHPSALQLPSRMPGAASSSVLASASVRATAIWRARRCSTSLLSVMSMQDPT